MKRTKFPHKVFNKLPRITARKVAREPGLAGVCQGPRGYVISITGFGKVGSVFAISKGRNDYIGWSFVIRSEEEVLLPRIQAWNEEGVVPPGKQRVFKMTDEGKEAAKNACIERIKKELKLAHNI